MMKRILIKLIFCMVIVAQPMLTYAANESSGWYPINQVYTYHDGSIFLNLSPSTAHPNPAGCSSGNWLRAMPDQTNIKEMYQMALTAQAAGMSVNAVIDGTNCSGSYAKILTLRSVN